MEEEEEQGTRRADGRFSVKSISISATSTREDEDEEWHPERQFHTNAQPLQMRIIVDLFRY